MTPRFRPRLTLPLPIALSVLACDPADSPDSQRHRSSMPSEPEAMVVLGAEQPPVRVTSYWIGDATGDVLDEEGFEGLLAGAEGTTADAQLVLRLDGVLPLGSVGIDEALVQLRRDDEVLDVPYTQFNFRVELDSDGDAVTELVFHRSSSREDVGNRAWHDHPLVAAHSEFEPVETIEYELVAADGTFTSCRAETSSIEHLSLGYTQIEEAKGRVQFDIADECIAVLEAAAESGPTEAFFVRCDRATTTASIGMHTLGDVTLKRGVFHATAVVEWVTQ